MALFILLIKLVSSFPAPAEAGSEHLPLILPTGLDQIAAAAPWNTHLEPPNGEFIPITALDADGSHGTGYDWLNPEAQSPDWRGIRWDTGYFAAYQFAAVVVLYLAPERLSGWSQEDKDSYSLSKWRKNIKQPVWDKDEWWVNYILHPYWGAAYYIRARERGFTRSQSFWFSFVLSTLYEYGAEALFEPVSIQDLVVTPLAGALLGEYLFSPIRQRVRAGDELNWQGRTVLFFTDPLGVVNDGLNRILGANTQVSFTGLKMEHIEPVSEMERELKNPLPARVPIKPVWGLQLKVRW